MKALNSLGRSSTPSKDVQYSSPPLVLPHQSHIFAIYYWATTAILFGDSPAPLHLHRLHLHPLIPMPAGNARVAVSPPCPKKLLLQYLYEQSSMKNWFRSQTMPCQVGYDRTTTCQAVRGSEHPEPTPSHRCLRVVQVQVHEHPSKLSSMLIIACASALHNNNNILYSTV